MVTEVLKVLNHIKDMISEQSIYQKEVLNVEEAIVYLNVSKSYLYKLTSEGLIPYYKPTGKIIYFKREELNEWMLQNKSAAYEMNVESLKFSL